MLGSFRREVVVVRQHPDSSGPKGRDELLGKEIDQVFLIALGFPFRLASRHQISEVAECGIDTTRNSRDRLKQRSGHRVPRPLPLRTPASWYNARLSLPSPTARRRGIQGRCTLHY